VVVSCLIAFSAKPGRVSARPASHPSADGFSCGFHPSLSSVHARSVFWRLHFLIEFRLQCFFKANSASSRWEIGVAADLFGLPEMAAFVSDFVRQEGAQGKPLERPKRSLGSGQVETVGFLKELA